MITREVVKQKILDYLLLRSSLEALVSWAEDGFMSADFEEKDAKLISDVLTQIGISNVRNFGIQWHEWKDLLLKLGYEMKIELSLTATTL